MHEGIGTRHSRGTDDRMTVSICIPVHDGVDMLDVTGPWEMFHWAEYEVVLCAAEAGPVRCLSGLAMQVNTTFADAPACDVLWTPGHSPPALAQLMNNRTYLDFLVRQAGQARFVCSVCEGALLLAAAGLLDDHEVTTHWAFTPCITERFPGVRLAEGHPRFVRDRDRLTGGGISSGLDEALELIRLMSGDQVAKSVQLTTQYYPQPPVSSAIPPADGCPVPA